MTWVCRVVVVFAFVLVVVVVVVFRSRDQHSIRSEEVVFRNAQKT